MTVERGKLNSILALHAEWLSSEGKAGKRANLSKCDLSMQNLAGLDLRRAILAGVNFERTILANTNFDEADLRHANLSYANLDFCSFVNTNLEHVIAYGASFEKAEIVNSVLDYATFKYARCEFCIITGTCYKVDFSYSNLSHSKLVNSHFEEVSFYNADLTYLVIRNTELHGVDFKNALLTDVRVEDSYYTDIRKNDNEKLFDNNKENKLSDRQLMRAMKFHKKGLSIGEISRKMRLKRRIIETNIESLIFEHDVNLAIQLHRKGKTIAQILPQVKMSEDSLVEYLDRYKEIYTFNRNIIRIERLPKIFKYASNTVFLLVAIITCMIMSAGIFDFFSTVTQRNPFGWHTSWFVFWTLLDFLLIILGFGLLLFSTKLTTDLPEKKAISDLFK